MAQQPAVDSQAAWIDDFDSGKRPCHHPVQETELITSERDGYFVERPPLRSHREPLPCDLREARARRSELSDRRPEDHGCSCLLS